MKAFRALPRAYLVIGAIVVALAVSTVVAFAVVFPVTDKGGFCPRCHEMAPYARAWQAGGHRRVECHRCHVPPGIGPYLANRVYVLREVRDHFFGDPKFPTGRGFVANARCLSCHRIPPAINKLLAKRIRFPHALHARKDHCADCHAQTGHRVALGVLALEGVLARHAVAPGVRAVSGGLHGHEPVICLGCHRHVSAPCAVCHSSPHPKRGPCGFCHPTGPKWVFAHPSAQAAADCRQCHAPPRGHFKGVCRRCHSPNVPFAQTRFKHPKSDMRCERCHPRSANHFAGNSCYACHRSAASWRFSHPASTGCVPCHTAPASHFGDNCTRCHNPSVPWSQATFSHPATGEHSYLAFSCEKCHPSGFTTASCTCHGGRAPGGD